MVVACFSFTHTHTLSLCLSLSVCLSVCLSLSLSLSEAVRGVASESNHARDRGREFRHSPHTDLDQPARPAVAGSIFGAAVRPTRMVPSERVPGAGVAVRGRGPAPLGD